MHRVYRSIAALGLAIILADCGGAAASPSAPGATATSGVASVSPEPSATSSAPSGSDGTSLVVAQASAAATAGSSASPAATPDQLAASAGGWSAPVVVGTAAGCDTPSTGIDAASRDHVVNACDGTIFYAMSNRGSTWTTATIGHPAHRLDLGPALAFQGARAYVAYTQVAVTDGGCGQSGLRDVGVYYRERSLPDGAWSEPRRLGLSADHLMAFRVAGRTIYATVTSAAGHAYYETLAGDVFHRYLIPGAVGGADLRIGADGRARIAYEGAASIRVGMFDGSRFTSSPVPGSSGGWAPQLLLGKRDQAYLMWVHAGRGGCAIGEDARDGTYFATDHAGTWASRRLSRQPTLMSFALDPRTGTVRALLWDHGLRLYTRDPAGVWHSTRLPAVPASAFGTVLRVDPATGRLLIVYEMSDGAGTSATMFAISKP